MVSRKTNFLKEEIEMKKGLLIAIGISLMAGFWTSMWAAAPAGIMGCVWRLEASPPWRRLAAPAGTMVYGKNISTGVVYCTQISQAGGWLDCHDVLGHQAFYLLNHDSWNTGIRNANGNCNYGGSAMPCGSYDVWAVGPQGEVSPTQRVNWTGNCTTYNLVQDLTISNQPSKH